MVTLFCLCSASHKVSIAPRKLSIASHMVSIAPHKVSIAPPKMLCFVVLLSRNDI
jgi:hypothetical protein